MQPESAGPPEDDKNLVVFVIRKEAACDECGELLTSGAMLRLESKKPLCMECADLDHLEYLPRGDAALTRRASKHSTLRAVVVRWSTARKRYERQGILAESKAIEQAERECMADADIRLRRQGREAVKREAEDKVFIASFAQAVRKDFPGCPQAEADEITLHACRKHSGRVGRSAAAKELSPDAVRLAVTAHIRHVHTKYDEMLTRGTNRRAAREIIWPTIEKVIATWKSPK